MKCFRIFSAVPMGTCRIFPWKPRAAFSSKSSAMDLRVVGSSGASSGTKGPNTTRPMMSPS